MGDRETAAKFLFILSAASLLLGLAVVGFAQAVGNPYSVETACRSNNRSGFYPYTPGCGDFVDTAPVETR